MAPQLLPEEEDDGGDREWDSHRLKKDVFHGQPLLSELGPGGPAGGVDVVLWHSYPSRVFISLTSMSLRSL